MRIRNILLVHTSGSVRAMIIKHILAEFGDAEIQESDTGRDAVFQLASKSFNVLISECDLADMHVTELKKMMVAGTINRNIEIIVLASDNTQAAIDNLSMAGFAHIVPMPFQSNDLLKKINSICNPRQWRQSDRYHIPGSKTLIKVWGMEAEAKLINISRGGVLAEVTGDRSDLLLQNDPKLTLRVKEPHGYYEIKDLPSKITRLNATEWNKNYKPTVMRVAYSFLDLPEDLSTELEQVLQLAKESRLHVVEDDEQI